MLFFIGFILVVVAVLMFVIVTYNNLVSTKKRVENGWAQIDVQLKQRVDLIPNLVETVKGYAKHEGETLERVISARNIASGASGIDESIEANNQLTGALKTLFAVAEAYPDLKANQGFVELQKTLKDIEEKIVFSRQFYNDIVTKYNTMIAVFPGNIVARMFKFEEEKLFAVVESERSVPEVKF